MKEISLCHSLLLSPFDILLSLFLEVRPPSVLVFDLSLPIPWSPFGANSMVPAAEKFAKEGNLHFNLRIPEGLFHYTTCGALAIKYK